MIDLVETRTILERVERALYRARSHQGTVLLSWTEGVRDVDALQVFRWARQRFGEAFFWERPTDGYALVGAGCSENFAGSGDTRFASAVQDWRDLLTRTVAEGPPHAQAYAGPILLGGFSFHPDHEDSSLWSGFPASRLVLPRLMLTETAAGSWLTINVILSSHDEAAAVTHALCDDVQSMQRECADSPMHFQAHSPSTGHGGDEQDQATDPAWKDLVLRARDTIRSGRAGKIVVARSFSLATQHAIDPVDVVARLRTDYPECTVFAVAREGSTFLGATPEWLVRLAGGEVRVDCLAGTIGRGATEKADSDLGRRLLGSAKDRAEHAVVVRAVTEALNPHCESLSVPERPRIMRLATVQHLHTPVKGRLIDGSCVLSLLAHLHPTPAVGGYPRAAAMEFLKDGEGFRRGWYAAPIGWVNRFGEGEFAVGIRSALMHPDSATLFAGCGIMADSEPDSEYRESCLKLQSLRSILQSARS